MGERVFLTREKSVNAGCLESVVRRTQLALNRVWLAAIRFSDKVDSGIALVGSKLFSPNCVGDRVPVQFSVGQLVFEEAKEKFLEG